MELPDFPGAPRIEGFSFLEPCLLLRQAGQGGMGLVYEAYDVLRSRKVAVKVSSNPAYSPRFYLEAVLGIADLGEHVVQVIDIRRFRETDYILMEWVDGGDLQTMTEAGALSTGQVIEVARQVCTGLSRIHEHGVIHRDIKPANLMVTYEGVIKLADLGIAQSSEALHLATVGPIGTRIFMAPEQREGQTADECSDMFSLGITLYMLATGLMNRQRSGELTKLLQEGLSPVLEIQPDLDPGLGALINRCCAWSREDRIQNTGELAEALQALEIQGQPVIPSRTRLMTADPSPELIRKARALRVDGGVRTETDLALPVAAPVAPPVKESDQPRPPSPWLQRTGGAIGLIVLSVIGAMAFEGPDNPPEPASRTSTPQSEKVAMMSPVQEGPATKQVPNGGSESRTNEKVPTNSMATPRPIDSQETETPVAQASSSEMLQAIPVGEAEPAFQLAPRDGFEVHADEDGIQAYIPKLDLDLSERVKRKLRFADLPLKGHSGLLVQEMEVAREVAFALGVIGEDPAADRCLPWNSVSLDMAKKLVKVLNDAVPAGAGYEFLVPTWEQRMIVESSTLFCSLALDLDRAPIERTKAGNAPSMTSSVQQVDPLRVYDEAIWKGSKTTGLYGFIGNVSEVCSKLSEESDGVTQGDYRGGSILDLQQGPIAVDTSNLFTRDYRTPGGGLRLFLLIEAE